MKGCYYIRQGELYVILFVESGYVGHMAHLKPGDYFGEHSLHKIGIKALSLLYYPWARGRGVNRKLQETLG